MKHILPLVISGFVLCGFFAVSLSAFLLPKSESEPVPETIQRVFYEEPMTLYYDTNRSNNVFCITVPFYEVGFEPLYYRYDFSYLNFGVFRNIVRNLNTPNYTVSQSILSNFMSLNNVIIRVTATNYGDNSDVYTWYFQYYFLPFPSSGSSSASASLRSVDDAAAEEVPADQVDAATEEVSLDQVDAATEEVSLDQVDSESEEVPVYQVDAAAEEDVSSEKNESED